MNKAVALVGSGLIGRGWAILFANAGYQVRIFDADANAAPKARAAIEDNLRVLAEEGMVDDAGALLRRLKFCTRLEEAIDGVFYVQESVFESRDVKAQVFTELGRITTPTTILASSVSAIPPEEFMQDVAHRERCIVAHPFSPPHLIPLVEIVVTRWTSPDVLERTCALMRELGQRPARVHKPIFGFVVNRLQAVVIDEAIALVKAGVIDPQDLDACMSQGLGLRWTFIGPFETMDLNSAHGFADYVGKYGDLYQKILESIRPYRPWSGEPAERIEKWRRSEAPTEKDVAARRLWRDRNLMRLAKLFRGPKLGNRPS